MNLLLFNLLMDADDLVLGFATRWVNALAQRCDRVVVITMGSRVIRVEQNVHVVSIGKERGFSEPRRLLTFYRELVQNTDGIDGCFSHMMPLFSALAGPFLRARRIPLVTWYAHPSRTIRLRVAHQFSGAVVTSLPNAYPYRRDKLHVIGQGIDTAFFTPESRVTEPGLVVCAGRLAPVKGHLTLLDAWSRVARSGEGRKLLIIGDQNGNADYVRSLKAIVAAEGLEETVTFIPGVSATVLRDYYRRATVHVNLTPAGFGDKVALEAMSCGAPSLVSNTDFAKTLGDHSSDLLFSHHDSGDLARRLETVLGWPESARREVGASLRANVSSQHGLGGLADRILNILNDLKSRQGG